MPQARMLWIGDQGCQAKQRALMQVAVVGCVDAPDDLEGMRPSPTCRPEAGWLDAPTDSEGVEAIANRLGHVESDV